jgi:hypothetical protein
MAKKRMVFSTCSEMDVRAAALKATHERMKEMDQRKEVTIGKFGEVLKEEQAKLRRLAEKDVEQGICRTLTWEELKKATSEIDKKQGRESNQKEFVIQEVV